MSSHVERLARAGYTKMAEITGDHETPTWEALPDEVRGVWREIIRAVLAETQKIMREAKS